jgi:hypothetical protein
MEIIAEFNRPRIVHVDIVLHEGNALACNARVA